MISKIQLLYKRGLNIFISYVKGKNNNKDINIIFNYSHSHIEIGLIKAIKEIMSK